MEYSDFSNLVDEMRFKKPALFGLETDPKATDGELEKAEALLGVQFPVEYKVFLKKIGGGYFGFTNVFSTTVPSFWNIVERNLAAASVHRDFVAFSDNGVGDNYGFLVDDGVCGSAVYFFDHETSEIIESGYSNLFSYLAAVGLKVR